MAHVVGVPKRDPCHKCQLPVFLAERLTIGKRIYHRTCLKCARCGTQLTPGSFYETEVDGEFCCETCPDEEDMDLEIATSSVKLRNEELKNTPLGVAAPQTTPGRTSIADRLAFFEQSQQKDVDKKLLQKSVSDEEKSKSLKRSEEAVQPAYKPNSALSSFLYDSIDGNSPAEEAESEPTSSAEVKTDTLESAATDDETEGDLSKANEQPELPKTPPPAELLPTKRFTATAQMQLKQPSEELTDMAVHTDLRSDNAASVIPERHTSEMHFSLSEVTPTPENIKSFEEEIAPPTPGLQKVNEEQTEKLTLKSAETNLELSPPNDNDCVTKEQPAVTHEIAMPESQQLLDALKSQLGELDSECSTDVEDQAVQTVELRRNPEEDQSQLNYTDDVATTERLSVVRARLQQFEVNANDSNKVKDNKNKAISPEKDNTSASAKHSLSEVEKVAQNNIEEVEEPQQEQLYEHKAIGAEGNVDSLERAIPNEVPLDCETKENESIATQDIAPKLKSVDTETASKSEVNTPRVPTQKIDSNSVETAPQKEENTEETATTKDTPDQKATSAPLTPKKSQEFYPEDLNPFQSEDEDEDEPNDASNKENVPQKSSETTLVNKPSTESLPRLNPFDSSDDEIELEKSRGSTASSTPSGKVPPPRPPPPRISRNPFGEETDEEAQMSRGSSLTSSQKKKTPVPTPRTNLSQSQNPTPEPTPRLSNKLSPSVLQNSSDFYGSANSLSTTPQSLNRSTDGRGSSNSLTSSGGGTIRSRKSRKAPAPPPPVKELFVSNENHDSSKASTPNSSTVGTPKLGRKKRPAPAPPKPARLDASLLSPINHETASKNLLSYPLQSEFDSKLSDEEKALLEGKLMLELSNTDDESRRSSRRLIPLDASLLEDHAVGQSDDLTQHEPLRDEESNVVYRRMLIPPSIDTPTYETNPLLEHLSKQSPNKSHDRQLEKLKDNKEANNRNRQSQLSTSSGNEDTDLSAMYNKSAHGKWKRRKGPAPALPIPPRKVLQMLPLQEIRHELEIIEVQQQGLEKQGVILEKMIRDRCEGENGELLPPKGSDATDDTAGETVKAKNVQNSKEVEDLILQLFELVNEKNELFRRQAELMYLRRQHRLEQEQADLEYEIRVLMAQPERNKTDTDKSREEALIARLVEVVQLRNDVVDCLEMDRLREAEEDLSIKQSLESRSSSRDCNEEENHKSLTKLSKKEKKKQKESKKLGKSKKLDADKDADETEWNTEKQKKKKKRKFLF